MRVPPDRQTKMAAVASRRLSGVTCVLEGLYDTGNIGAVARSAESFGITNLGVITLHGDKFKTKHGGRTAGGAEKWIDFTKSRRPKSVTASSVRMGTRSLSHRVRLGLRVGHPPVPMMMTRRWTKVVAP
eukprot:m.296316 g.296316  ORF g.296316 m.296316 type:complete len:129 (-) comp27192_c0_seq1:2619-3005(-)